MGGPKTRKRLPLSIMVFLAVLGLVVALNAVHVVGRVLLAKTARRVVVEEGTMTLGTFGEAVFLRRELILVAPQAGIWHPQVSKGQRVSAGTNIGEVLNTRLLNQARELQERARGEKTLWESELTAKKEQLERALDEVNEKVLMLLAELRNDVAKMQITQTQQQRDRLQELLKQRGYLSTEKEQLEQETAQGGSWREIEATATELMTQATTAVITPLAGRFEDCLDGYEDIFDPLEYKTALMPLTPTGSVGTVLVSAGDHVDQGQIVGKITQEDPTFIRVGLREKLDNLSLDDKVEVYLPTQEILLQAEIKALAHEESETIAVLRLQSAPPTIASVREAEVQMIFSRIRGAVIPKQALIYLNGQEGVYLWQRDKWVFTPVKVISLDKERVIVSGIKPGEEVALGLRF